MRVGEGRVTQTGKRLGHICVGAGHSHDGQVGAGDGGRGRHGRDWDSGWGRRRHGGTPGCGGVCGQVGNKNQREDGGGGLDGP